jgi:hypothetical protein
MNEESQSRREPRLVEKTKSGAIGTEKAVRGALLSNEDDRATSAKHREIPVRASKFASTSFSDSNSEICSKRPPLPWLGAISSAAAADRSLRNPPLVDVRNAFAKKNPLNALLKYPGCNSPWSQSTGSVFADTTQPHSMLTLQLCWRRAGAIAFEELLTRERRPSARGQRVRAATRKISGLL